MGVIFVRQAINTGMLLALIGCQTLATAEDIPARIVNPTEASRKALQDTIHAVLATRVTLADDALTGSSILTLEHNPSGNMQNMAATGRTLTAPIQFRLLRNGVDCILVDQRDDSRHTLMNTKCAPE